MSAVCALPANRMTEAATEPTIEWFDDSRRLTGPNLFFQQCGAVLDAAGPAARHEPAYTLWRDNVAAICAVLNWPAELQTVVRRHAAGASLALSAPVDQLFTATEINEWAWHRATLSYLPEAFDAALTPPRPLELAAALHHFQQRAALERNPKLMTLLALARQHRVDALLDDDTFSLGTGARSRCWPVLELPEPGTLVWSDFGNIPIALVTGSNGKTTTVRLLAAMVRASAAVPGYNCTTGVVIDQQSTARGDYAGPAGARMVLRDTRVQVALLETARGGLLRRGLACSRADVAVITNVSPEHFGEYGVDNVGDLAQVKAIVVRGLGADGVLVLNADDAVLMHQCFGVENHRVALFAFDDMCPQLVNHRAGGGATCGVHQGRLRLSRAGAVHDIESVAAMPLSVGGVARYNVANMAAAALAALHLGLPVPAIATVLSTFGQSRHDNPGRLERWDLKGLTVMLDYAHNPAGLEGLLTVAQAVPHAGRLGLLLGQAGNRDDGAIAEMARTAARFKPARVVLKDIAGYLRGRQAGEVPALLRRELLAAGLEPHQIDTVLSEADAARALIAWARAGDIVVLPIHESATLEVLRHWLDGLQACDQGLDAIQFL